MPRNINGWESTYELNGRNYCACGFPFYTVRYRWKGEKEIRCSATCLLIASLQEERVCDDDGG